MGKLREVFAGKRDSNSVYGLWFGDGSGDAGGTGAGVAAGDAAGAAAADASAGVGVNGPGGMFNLSSFAPPPPAAAPPPPSAGTQGMNRFTDLLLGAADADGNRTGGMVDKFTNNPLINDGPNGQRSIYGQYGDIASGVHDPRFDAFKNQQLNQTQDFFSRRGLEGSSAALNAMNKVEESFGLQEMQRQDNALAQQAGIYEQGLGQTTAGLQNLTTPKQVEIAQLAAKNAGKSSGGGGGKK